MISFLKKLAVIQVMCLSLTGIVIGGGASPDETTENKSDTVSQGIKHAIVEAKDIKGVAEINAIVGAKKNIIYEDIALASMSPVKINNIGLNVHNYNNKPMKVAIHDSKGRVVYNRNFSTSVSAVTVETSGYAPGAYLYSIKIGDTFYSKSFFITR